MPNYCSMHSFEVGDVWEDHIGTRTIIAVYERDVLVRWQPHAGAGDGLVLPQRLFNEGCCGTLVVPGGRSLES